nr:glutathione S-transferase family protein [Moritella sp. Urea-trap-13]
MNKRRDIIYTLYWDRGGANMATHAVLEELGVAYELVEIDLAKQMQRTPEYLAINPNGKVPTLQHRGEVIYESAAILMYILDQHPDSGLAPALHSPQRGHYYQFLTWMSNTLQEAANRWAHPEHYITSDVSVGGDTDLSQVVDKATQDLNRCWSIIDDELGNKGPWLLGDNISGADFHLFMVAYWSRRYDSRAQDWPNLCRHQQAMLQRNSIQQMMSQEGLTFEC